MIRKNKKATKNFIWNAVGLTFNSFNSLFFLVAVKLINGMNEAGVFTYAFSLCCLFYMIAIFYNRTYQVSDTEGRFDFSDYLSLRLILSTVSFVLIFIFSLVSGFDFHKILVILLLMGFRIVEAISDCFYGELHKKGRLDQTGISLFVKAIFGLGIFIGLDLLTRNILVAIAGIVVLNFAILNLYDIRNYRKISHDEIKFKTSNIKSLLKNSWPVFVFSVLGVFLANCQKYVLTYFADNDIQAIFGMLIMPATVISLAGSYLVNPFVGKLTEIKNKKKYAEFRDFGRKLIFAVLEIGILGLIVCGFIGIPVLNFVYQIDLNEYWLLLEVIIVGAIFTAVAMFPSAFLTILRENKVQSIIYAIISAASLALSIILIPFYGITGAVIAYMVAGALLLLMYIIKYIRTIERLR